MGSSSGSRSGIRVAAAEVNCLGGRLCLWDRAPELLWTPRPSGLAWWAHCHQLLGEAGTVQMPLAEDTRSALGVLWTLSSHISPSADFSLTPFTVVSHNHEQGAGNSASPANKFLHVKAVLGTPDLAVSVRVSTFPGPRILQLASKVKAVGGISLTSHMHEVLLPQTQESWFFSRKSNCMILWAGCFLPGTLC